MSKARSNPYSIGEPAEALFYGRQDQVEKIAAALTAPVAVSYSLIGGRRFGKTSLLLAVRRHLWNAFSCASGGEYRVIPVYINLLGDKIEELTGFFALALDSLHHQLSESSISEIPSNWSDLSPFDFGRPPHQSFAGRLINLCQNMASKGTPGRVVLLLDEIEEILDQPWRHDLFNQIRWLISENSRTRSYLKVILAGSDHFHKYMKQKSSPLCDVLEPEYLATFPERETLRLIQEPCDEQVPEEVAREILHYTGGHPYLVQYFMHHLWEALPLEATPQQVRELAGLFMGKHWSRLEGWRESVGELGCRAYAALLSHNDWVELTAIRQVIEGETLGLVPTLTALCYHGLAIHDHWRYYRVVGGLFREWFVKNFSYFELKEAAMPEFLFTANALLIGVGDYIHPRFAGLPATVHDAQAIAAVLTDPSSCGYPPANVQVLTGEQATSANIRAALKTLAESTNPESIAFVYFSGHGGRVLENGVWRAYLCPREADPDALANTAIPGDEFSVLLAAIPARKLLVMLDACHAAGSAELKAANGTVVWKAGLPGDYYEALSQGSGRVVVASSKEDQFSYVRPQGDLSLFTHHLLQALSGKAAVRGDGMIHVLDVFHYVNEAVQADEPKQVPILKVKDLDLNFPIALALGGKAAGPAISVTPVANIRERIVRDPIAGAKALSDYLATHPQWWAKRNEVDLKRADLERIQHDLDLFGPNPSDQAAKNRDVYFLLRVCLELERPEQ